MALRILTVTSGLPYPPASGAAIRIFQFARHIAQRHKLTLLSYAGPDVSTSVAELREMGIEVILVPAPNRSFKRLQQVGSLVSPNSHLGTIFLTARFQRALDAILNERRHDVVLVEGSLLMRHQFLTGVPLVLDEHNVEFEALERTAGTETSPLRRRFSSIEAAKFKREEFAAWRRADLCIFTSDREVELVHELSPNTASACVPNGVDLEYFRSSLAPTDPHSVVFTGTIGYRPNADAVQYLVRDILPRILRSAPDTVVTIVGGGAPSSIRRLAGRHVVFTGRVPDVRPFVDRAAIVVAPLRIGSGTRLKVLEAFAMGKAMVATGLGCEGIACRSGEHLLIADGAERFADEVIKLLEDPARRAALGAHGRNLAERLYGWPVLAGALETALEEVVRRDLNRPARAASLIAG